MITIMRGYVAVAGAALLLLAGCSSEPSEAEQRAADCEAFASETPGTLERDWATDVMSDPDSTPEEQQDAMKVAARGSRDRPYDCDVPADQQLFEHYREMRSE